MPRENRTRYAVLGVLAQAPATGYDIKKQLEQSVGHFWHEGFGQIYPLLHTLSSEGLATVEVNTEAGRPARKVYTITDAGREALRTWLERSVEESIRPRNEVLLKLFHGAESLPQVSIGHVAEHRDAQAAQAEALRRLEAEYASTLADERRWPYRRATLRYGIRRAEATVAWCDETLDELWSLARSEV